MMQKKMNIVLVGTVVSNLIWGLGATTTVNDPERLLQQRKADLADTTPLSTDETNLLTSLLRNGALKVHDSDEAADPTKRRRLTKAAKHGGGAMTGRNGPATTGRHEHDVHEEEPSHHDDYYYHYYYEYDYDSRGKGKGGSKGSKGSSGDGDDGGLVELTMEGFQDSRDLQPPVLTGVMDSEFEAGTVYLYNSEMLLGVEADTSDLDQMIEVQFRVDENFQIGVVSGKCTRIDVADPTSFEYEGRSHCQFVYSFLNEAGEEEAELTAEGIVTIGAESRLATTGGTGLFRRASGYVLLNPVAVGEGPNPELSLSEFNDLPTSWFMRAFLYLESSLVPPDLFATV